MANRRCNLKNCDRPHKAHGLCAGHFRRFRKNGQGFDRSPITVQRPRGMTESQVVAYFRSEIPTDHGCLEWNGTRDECGYGRATFGDSGDNRYAHRLAYEDAHGPIPDNALLRHTCDNPPCCNPEHLILGDKRSNSQDAYDRGLSRVGDARPNTKISDADVKAICIAWGAGARQKDLAEQYGCAASFISMLVNNKRRLHTPR